VDAAIQRAARDRLLVVRGEELPAVKHCVPGAPFREIVFESRSKKLENIKQPSRPPRQPEFRQSRRSINYLGARTPSSATAPARQFAAS
jgi:hypothetical protein